MGERRREKGGWRGGVLDEMIRFLSDLIFEVRL